MIFNEFYKIWNKLFEELFYFNLNNPRCINNLNKTADTIRNIKRVYSHVNNYNVSIRQAILDLNLYHDKSTIYSWMNKIANIKSKEEIPNLVVKNTGPKIIKYKYDQETRKLIADAKYIQHHSRANIWMHMKQIYPDISLKTVCKIINNDDRNPKKKKRAPVKHPLRYYDLPFGCIQMDLKIIGPKESPTGKRITIYDAKDEQSKLYYMEVIENASGKNLLQATRNMIHYFTNELGITIKRIRTDNAMMFKQNNFVKSYDYNNLLIEYGIENQKIQLMRPQQNGVIERHHGIIDQEFKPLINKFDTVKRIKEKAKIFMNNFNFNRYHYYEFLSKCSDYKKFESKFFIPWNFYLQHSKHSI